MPQNPITELMAAQDVSPNLNDFDRALTDIQNHQLDSNERNPNLSELANSIDDQQARNIAKTLRERIRAPQPTEHDPYTEVKIGTTWLQVPPANIRVKDMRFNDDVSGLRSTTNSLIKTGRGRIKIDMTLEFPNETAINEQLRPIIAQFRTVPFLPLESQYVYNTIMAYAAQIDPKYLDDLRLKLDRVWTSYKQVQDQMIQTVTKNPTLLGIAVAKYGSDEATVVERYRSMFPDELVTEVSDLLQGAYVDDLAGAEFWDKGSAAAGDPDSQYSRNFRALVDIENLSKAAGQLLDEIRNIYDELNKAGVPEASRRPVVHVVLHTLQVGTVSGERDNLRAQLSMIFFAYGAYVSELAYKNPEGYPTLDVEECPYFDAYVRRRYLQASSSALSDQDEAQRGSQYLGKYSAVSGQSWRFRYPTPQFRQVPDDELGEDNLVPPIRAEHIGGGRAYNLAAKNSEGKQQKWVPGEETLSIGPEDDIVIPSQVVVVLQNRIALQPIQSSLYGTVQHLGAINARISVAFTVTGNERMQHDYGVAKIQRMKLQSERVALIGGPKVRRNSRIQVTNGILSLMGVKYAQLDDVTVRTNPGETWSSIVQLDMTEYTVSQEKREQLRLQRPDAQGSLIKGSIEFGSNLVDKYLRGNLIGQRGFLAVASDAGQYCRAALYGTTEDPNGGIITVPLIAHIILNRAEIRQALLKKARDAAIEQSTGKNSLVVEEMARLPVDHGRRKLLQRTEETKSAWPGTGSVMAKSGTKPESSLLRQFYEENAASKDPNASRVLPELVRKRLADECFRLAVEMVSFWKRSKIQLVKNVDPAIAQVLGDQFGEVPRTIRDSKDVIDIEDTPGAFLSDIYDTLRNHEDFADTYKKAKAFGDYCFENFEPVQEYYRSRLEAFRGESNYPDLDLPTYEDIFLSSKEAVSESLGTDVEGLQSKLLRHHTYKYMGPKTKKIIRRFIPTYRDLGRRAPIDQDPYDPAKQFHDFVDPDFIYFHNRLSSKFDSFADEVEDETEQLYSPSTNYMGNSKGKRLKEQMDMADAKRVQQARVKSEELGRKFIDAPDDVTMSLDPMPDPDGRPASCFYRNGQWQATAPKVGFGADPYHKYTSGDPEIQKMLNKFVHDDPSHLSSLFRETMQSQKDNVDRMLRAFPTFRFEFIEVDNEEYGFWDDFYSYNAIIDIQMSEHKFEPSLLQIRIINTTGTLDEARSMMEDPDKVQEDASWVGPDGEFRDPRKPIGSPELEAGTGEPRQMSKFFLQTGTNVRLRMGYGSGEDDLETVFLGQVAEVRPGDIITLICQSYKSELTVPLNTYKSGYGSDPFDVLKWVMNESPTEHFGKWSPLEAGLFSGRNKAGELFNQQSSERLGFQGYRRGPSGDSEAASQARSVYTGTTVGALEMTGGFTGYNTFAGGWDLIGQGLGGGKIGTNTVNAMVNYLTPIGVVSGLAQRYAAVTSDRKMSNVYLPRHSAWRELFSTSREFLIPDRSGLEVIHELTRHLPGHIADVRPYDHHVTLFFGKPEQRYYYTALKQNEERLWQQFQQRQTEEAKAAEEAFVRLMSAFETHPMGVMFKASLRARRSGSKDFWKETAGVVGSLPGKALGFVTFGLLGKDYEKAGERIGRNMFFGYYESPDRRTELAHIEKYLGRMNVKALMVYFFNKYASNYGAGEATAKTLLGISLAIATFGQGTGTLKEGVKGFVTGEHFAGDQVGTLMATLNGWRDKLEAITVKNDGTTKFNNDLRYQTFEMSTDVKLFNTMRDSNAGVVDATGRQIDRERYEKAVEAIIDYIPEWKDFLSFLDLYLQLKIAEQDTDLLKEAYKTGRLIERFEHNPRTKKFRNHHYVDSVRHIIKNGIIATKEQMANTVVVKYPDDVDYNEGGGKYYVAQDMDWNTIELPADQNIQISEKKVRLITEINADDSERAKLAAYSNLAEALRPMYRGELVLRGDERIRPNDTVWVNDTYENIYGPVEVERVITHFSAETGYTTTVIPQLVAIPASRSSWIDNLACGQANAIKSIWSTVTLKDATEAVGLGTSGRVGSLVTLAGATAFPPTALIGATVYGAGLVGGGLYQSFALKEQTGTGIFGNLTGRGRYGSLRTPVDIIPLIRNGIPWTAGLRGWGDDNWKLRLFKKWSNIKRGTGVFGEGAKSLLFGS